MRFAREAPLGTPEGPSLEADDFVVKFSEGDGPDLKLERGLEPSRPSVRLSTVDTGAAPVSGNPCAAFPDSRWLRTG